MIRAKIVLLALRQANKVTIINGNASQQARESSLLAAALATGTEKSLLFAIQVKGVTTIRSELFSQMDHDEGPTCVVIGDNDDIQRATALLKSIEFFSRIESFEPFSVNIDLLSKYEYVALTDPEYELLFLDHHDAGPWVLVWDPNYAYKFLVKERILIVPTCQYTGDPKFIKHFKKMLEQSKNQQD